MEVIMIKLTDLLITEGDKKKYWDLYTKWYKTYEAFARETMSLAKSTTKVGTTGSTDERIILKNFKKHVIPFVGLMSSWSKGRQDNPHIDESVNEAANKIADIRKILKTKKGKRIDSIFMDVETAEKVIKHYKSLKDSAKEKFVKQKIQNIVKSVDESVNEAPKQNLNIDQAYDEVHDAIVNMKYALQKGGYKAEYLKFQKWWDQLDRFYPDGASESVKEIASPLINHLEHAIEDVDYLIDAVYSEEANDAFDNPKQSKKLLMAIEKLLKKVR
jgi:hypothetical protein